MKTLLLRCLVLAWALVLLAWPATALWAAITCTGPGGNTICINDAVPETTPIADFELDANGTAYHKKTGLTWKRCAEGQTWESGNCTEAATNHTWSQALQLGLASNFAGFNDWRLPNQKELGSIVERRNFVPAINATVFPNTPDSFFWSASPYAPIAASAWLVDFYDGNGDPGGKGHGLAVRLVRGGQYALLSVTKAGSGSGTVASNLPGVDCGQFCKGSFANEMFTKGQVVLTATPDANSTFGSWTDCPSANGNQCTVNSAGDRTVTATFKANTTTTISDTPDPSVVGQAVVVNFTVAAVASGAGVPTGTVTVLDGLTIICSNIQLTAGSGTCSYTFTSPGSKTLTATYAGDDNFSGSISADELHTVNKANTTTTITSDTPDPSAVGQAVAVNFTVAAAAATPMAASATVQVVAPGPTGTVTVTANSGESCGPVTLSSGEGSCNLAFTSPGTKTLTATYVGGQLQRQFFGY